MSILETVVEASFKKSSTGETLFFPWGTLGKGYVVPNAEEEAAIRKFLRRYYVVTFIVAIGSIGILGGVLALFVIVPLLGWYTVWAKGKIKSLPTSSERLNYKESSKSLALRLPFGLLVGLFGISFAFALAGLLLALAGQLILGLAILLFFGACAYLYMRMLAAKRRRDEPRI